MKKIVVNLLLASVAFASQSQQPNYEQQMFEQMKLVMTAQTKNMLPMIKRSRECVKNSSTKVDAQKCALQIEGLKKYNENDKIELDKGDKYWKSGEKESLLKEMDKGIEEFKVTNSCLHNSTTMKAYQVCLKKNGLAY